MGAVVLGVRTSPHLRIKAISVAGPVMDVSLGRSNLATRRGFGGCVVGLIVTLDVFEGFEAVPYARHFNASASAILVAVVVLSQSVPVHAVLGSQGDGSLESVGANTRQLRLGSAPSLSLGPTVGRIDAAGIADRVTVAGPLQVSRARVHGSQRNGATEASKAGRNVGTIPRSQSIRNKWTGSNKNHRQSVVKNESYNRKIGELCFLQRGLIVTLYGLIAVKQRTP